MSPVHLSESASYLAPKNSFLERPSIPGKNKLNVLNDCSVNDEMKCHFIYQIKIELHLILILFRSVGI